MGEYVNPLWKNFAPQHRVENLLLVEQNKVNYRDIRGKPYITVSAKGIANGLSDILNDGADFGPDTPNTQTSGIQEALDYEAANYGNGIVQLQSTHNDLYPFQIYTDILFPNIPKGKSLTLRGMGRTSGSVLMFNAGCNKGIDYGANYSGNFVGNTILEKLDLWANTSTLTSLLNIPSTIGGGYVQLIDVQYGGPVVPTYSDAAIYISGVDYVSLVRCSDEQGNGNGVKIVDGGHVRLTDYRGAGANVTFQGNNYVFLDNKNGTPITLQNNVYIHITGSNGGATVSINGTDNFIIKVDGIVILSGIPLFDITSGATVYSLIADDVALQNNTTDTQFLTNSGTLYHFSRKNMQFDNSNASTTVFPFYSSTEGITAGTVAMQIVDSTPIYSKYVITFTGYENNTTTNQTIDFPQAFTSYAGVSLNTTGLVIAVTTSGITITAPDSTTAYSGIVIVEGY